MKRELKINEIYRHFKGKLYKVLLLANDSETNNDLVQRKVVVYQALYGDQLIWVRDYDMFLSEVDHEKYPSVKQQYRFQELTREEAIKELFVSLENEYPEKSLDELLYEVFNRLGLEGNFSSWRSNILETLGIDEVEYYTKNVNPELKKYVEEYIFPQYEPNDKAHGIVHILEVIRRSFALNDTFKLGLDVNMIYAIAACHDLGKYEDHSIHEKIAAKRFINDSNMSKFFTDEQREIIKEAIEDHRSSKEDEPRSIYGKLISSADRNTRIEIVFIRSFFVAKERMPEENIEDYLNYTIKRLSQKYSEENPENMFFEDETYKVFLKDMRALLKDEEEFKKRYCEVNHITNRSKKIKDEMGEVTYLKRIKKGD